MWMNLHQLPAGQSMFTLAVTNQPVDTPLAAVAFDEVDVVARSDADLLEVIETADLAGYEGWRVIGVINASAGYVVADRLQGDLRKELGA